MRLKEVHHRILVKNFSFVLYYDVTHELHHLSARVVEKINIQYTEEEHIKRHP